MKRLTLLILCMFAVPVGAQTDPNTARFAIGVAVPTSGEYAPLGKQLVQAAQLAARETNARVIVADTGGEPQKAIEAIATLAADPAVIAIVGPIGQRESRAAASAAQRFGVPLFTLATTETVNQTGGWVFRVRTSPAEQARAMATVAREQLGLKTTAILYPKNSYGSEAALAFAHEFLRRGGKVAAVANYPEDTTDFADVLDVIGGKKVYLGKKGTVDRWKTDASGFAQIRRRPEIDFEALFIPDFHGRVARVLAFLPLAGIQNGNGGEGVAVQLLGLAGWQGKSIELAGGAAAGSLYLDTFAGESAGGRAEEFSRTFEQHTARRPVDIEAETFDIVWLLASLAPGALATAKDADVARASLVRALPRDDAWTGVAGALRFDRDGAPRRDPRVYRFDADGLVAPAY